MWVRRLCLTSKHETRLLRLLPVVRRHFTAEIRARYQRPFIYYGGTMSVEFYDVIVAKEYEHKQNGTTEIKTAWNRVGKAWPSKSGGSMSFELFMLPGHRYVIQLQNSEARNNE